MDKPMISVIVPVYNVEEYIRPCLESICAQTFNALEIIIIDDGSTDRSGGICDEYAERDSRIRVVHQENRGLSAARNKGLDMATCELVGFVDSDDRIEPDMYKVLYENLCKYDADISTCAHDRTEVREGDTFAPFLRSRVEAMLAVLKDPYVSVYAWNKLYRKKLFDGVRYPEGMLYEDSYIILDLLEAADRMVSTTAPLYHYTLREKSITVRAYHTGEEDRVRSAEKIMMLAKNKYSELIPIAKTRYILAHYLCLDGILSEGKNAYNAYTDKRKEHARALRKNLFFVLFSWPKDFPFQMSPTFYLKVLCPRLFLILKRKLNINK